MPIRDLQLRFAQVGVIRLGEQVATGNVKNGQPTYRPAKLSTFRFTSPSRALIDAVAGMHGGEVRPWQSNTGPQWEVISKAKEIPVLVPPQVVDPNYELWGNGFRSRMCDGETEQIRNSACMCLTQFGPDFTKTAPPGKACKPTTRMSLMLANLVSLGTWKLESHGWNAAAELPMLASAIATAPEPLPARLEIQVRQKKILKPDAPKDKQIETRDYMVPVLHFDLITPAQAFGGQIGAAARTAVGGAEQPQAISSAPEPPEALADSATTVEQFKVLAGLARNPQTIRALWEWASKCGVLDDDLRSYLTARAEKLGAQVKTPAQQPQQPSAPTQAPADDVVIAETEPDGVTVWNEVVGLAGERGWNMPTLAEKFTGHMGFDYRDDRATGWKLAEFRDAVKAGQVQ